MDDTHKYDVLIVGSGAAGCVLAERLSADPSCKVLLLEAGPRDDHPFIHMPRGIGKILTNRRYIWPFSVSPRERSNADPEIWVRGKTLGGSSSVNGMMYVRSQPGDGADLAELAGPDWNWGVMADAYRSMEAGADDKWRNRLRVSLPPRHSLMDRFIRAGASIGLKDTDDVNHPDDEARIGYCPSTIWKGRRQSAAVAFLHGAEGRSNLTVRTGVSIDQILWDGTTATGVLGNERVEEIHYYANRVILSAGTFGSPAILERSGVGSRERMEALSIECKIDRAAVGENMREHCALALQFRLNQSLSLNSQFSGARLAFNAVRYFATRRGPMASAAYDVLGQFRTRPELDRPDAQMIAAPFSIDKSQQSLAMEREPGMQIAVYPLRPESTGSTHIVSRDANVYPEAHLDYFASEGDCRTMIGAVRFVRDLVASDHISGVITSETRPGPNMQSDDDILAAYREMGTPAYHACGTCRMGNDDDAVIDSATRVRGAQNLHVVDLSIAPVMPAGNTFAPVAAMAWHAADLIQAKMV